MSATFIKVDILTNTLFFMGFGRRGISDPDVRTGHLTPNYTLFIGVWQYIDCPAEFAVRLQVVSPTIDYRDGNMWIAATYE